MWLSIQYLKMSVVSLKWFRRTTRKYSWTVAVNLYQGFFGMRALYCLRFYVRSIVLSLWEDNLKVKKTLILKWLKWFRLEWFTYQQISALPCLTLLLSFSVWHLAYQFQTDWKLLTRTLTDCGTCWMTCCWMLWKRVSVTECDTHLCDGVGKQKGIR